MYSIHVEVGYLLMYSIHVEVCYLFMHCMDGMLQRQIPEHILMLLANEYPITFKVFQIFCND